MIDDFNTPLLAKELSVHRRKNTVRPMKRFRPECFVVAVFVVATVVFWHRLTVLSGNRYQRGDDDEQLYGDSSRTVNAEQETLMRRTLIRGKGDSGGSLPVLEHFRKDLKIPKTFDHNMDLSSGGQLKHWQKDVIYKIHRKPDVKPIEDVRRKFILDTEIPAFNALRIKSESKALKIDDIRNDKWIVLTTVNTPTDDVKFLANLTGWKVVVVGDTKTPKDWSYPNCVYLSVAKQKEIGLSIVPKLPFKHYARKNAGYLYAIAHGAKVIYETDDDNRPLDKLQSFELAPSTSGLMFAGTHHFNPYRHFGQPTLWPRGFPLSKVGGEEPSIYRFSSNWITPAIQQGIVNGDPDMDAIFRLTRKKTLQPLDVRFDPAAPPVLLPAGVFSPFNSQNTLFLKQGLWALMIPTTTTFRICDIWRGYWAQRLLWEIDGHLGFFPPNAYQQRNAHDYMADADQENGMYYNTDRLLAFLAQWQCPVTLSFFQCSYKLSADMATERFWEDGDVVITKLWLEDLIRVGYTEPKRKAIAWRRGLLFKSQRGNTKAERESDHKLQSRNLSGKNEQYVESDLDKRRLLTLNMGSSVTFSPAIQQPPSISFDESSNASPVTRHAQSIAKVCPGLPALSLSTPALNARASSPFGDILLVIVFNWPFYGNIWYTEAIHRPLFPNILYCGCNSTLFMRDTAFLGKNLSFVDVHGFQRGYFSHVCALTAMQMGYKVKGYLVVGDDVLLNTWNFARFDKDKIWMIKERYVFNISGNTNWMWWKTNMGSLAYHSSMNALKSITTSDERSGTWDLRSKDIHSSELKENLTFSKRLPSPRDYLAQLYKNTGNVSFGVHAISDVYYIPQRLRTGAVVYINHFLEYNLFLELSLPLTLYGLDNVANFESFDGVNLWMEERTNPWSRFTLDNHFLHPVKLSASENLLPLCTTYLPVLLAKGHEVQANLTG